MRLTLLRHPIAAAAACAFAASSGAATFNVSSDATLRSALAAATNGDVINFTGNVTVSGADLPAIQSNLTINGNGLFLSGANNFRGLFVYSGNVAVNNLSIRDTLARGGTGGTTGGGGGAGLGGGLFVASGASVALDGVSFSGNAAVGGNGGAAGGTTGGGGGGMGGNGSVGNGGGGGGLGSAAAGGGRAAAGAAGIVTGGAGGGAGNGGALGGAGGGGGGGGGTPFPTAGGGGGVGGGAAGASTGGNGGFGGGGGGLAVPSGGAAGNGGFGGGGGGTFGAPGGIGGFGGGGGAGPGSVNGAGGFGAGAGGASGGGGGAGMGGAVFVMQGGSLTYAGAGTVSGSSVTAGTGNAAGSALGAGMYLHGNGSVTFAPGANQTLSFADAIVDQSGVGGTGANAGTQMLVKSGAGTLVLGATNAYSGGTRVNDGVLQFSSVGNLGSGGVAFAGGTLELTGGSVTLNRALSFEAGAGRMLVGGGASLTLSGALSGAAGLVKTGTGTLVLAGSNLNHQGGSDIQAGVLRLTGSLNSDVVNVRSGGTFDVAGGSVNGATVNVFAGGALSASTSGIYTNLGQLSLQGGSALANIVNLNRMDARGSVVDLDNQADLTLSGQLNAGGSLVNSGTFNLNGMALAGAGSFVNSGTLRGPGSVSVTAENSGGLIQATGGTLLFTDLTNNRLGGQMTVAGGATLRVQSALNNVGVVTMNGGTFSGGAVTNTGTIEGAGFVQNRVDNTAAGTLRASAGGSLILTAAASTSSGLLAVDPGATMRFNAGLVQSAGTLAVNGGTFDNNGIGLVNTASGVIAISGNSRLASGLLQNQGRFNVGAATLVVGGALRNDGSASFEQSSVTFQGNVLNAATMTSTRSTLTFLAGFTNTGTFTTDPNLVITTDVLNQGMGAIVAAAGDRFRLSGKLGGDTRNNLAWDTDSATLQFSAAPGGVHLIELSGIDRGASRDGLQANFAWGALVLDAGQQLVLTDTDANWASGAGALYLGVLDLSGVGGDVGTAVAGRIIGNGFNVYYDPALSGNVWLGGQTYALGGGGSLTPLVAVPEPAPAALLALGVAVLGWRLRRAVPLI